MWPIKLAFFFILLYVGCLFPSSFFVKLHFSNYRSNWTSPPFSSAAFQNYFTSVLLHTQSVYKIILSGFLLWIMRILRLLPLMPKSNPIINYTCLGRAGLMYFALHKLNRTFKTRSREKKYKILKTHTQQETVVTWSEQSRLSLVHVGPKAKVLLLHFILSSGYI